MVDAVERIVWDQNLTSTNINDSNNNENINEELEDELQDNNLKPEEVLTEDQQNDYKEFKKQLEEAKKAEIEFINNNQIKKESDSDEDLDENDNTAPNDESDKNKIRPKAKAFSVIDRIIHAYVCDESKKILIIKDLSITPENIVEKN